MAFLGKVRQSFGSTFSFFSDCWTELKKVRWPSRKEMTSYTLVVLVTILIIGVYFWLLDIGISQLLDLLL